MEKLIREIATCGAQYHVNNQYPGLCQRCWKEKYDQAYDLILSSLLVLAQRLRNKKAEFSEN